VKKPVPETARQMKKPNLGKKEDKKSAQEKEELEDKINKLRK